MRVADGFASGKGFIVWALDESLYCLPWTLLFICSDGGGT